MATEWSIQELARSAGTTSRTLRHYGEIGLLPPSRIGANGYRFYDQESLVRLQRILLLRELGLALPAIAEVLAGQRDTSAALRAHLELLKHEQDRIARQIASVHTTLRKTEAGEPLMAKEVFDGFDHSQYRDEVTERWGKDAWESGNTWWNAMSDTEKQEHSQTHLDIAADYGRARAAGLAVESEQVQAIVERHFRWVTTGWQGKCPTSEYFVGLGEMYVADPRFAINYDKHGEGTAVYVRDAMRAYADARL
ncbi:MerR family transcriptional regulator [Nocardia jejuensis]|uniref:MerR family transcriptional regulator n=1 Tax=Nocardia jejuensis TaxID=328049 RepID=UPI00082DD1CB|nr:MerR family transcriptional regulator [Nocardia jejuensis]